MANTYLRSGEKEMLQKTLIENKFGKELNDLTEKCRKEIIRVFNELLPSEEVKSLFKAMSEMFVTSTSLSLTYNDDIFKNFFDKDLRKKYFNVGYKEWNTIYLNGSRKILFNKEIKKLFNQKMATKPEELETLKTLLSDYVILSEKRSETKNKLKCLFNSVKWTPTKLKSEFPEAYEVYIKMGAENSDGAINLCDSVENIRAILS
jgi:hypothetical protein